MDKKKSPIDKQTKKILKVMVICAHPDDADLLSGGLCIKLTSLGHKVIYISVTNGNIGHYKINQKELAAIRQKEALASAQVLGADYESLNIDDGQVYVNREQTEKVVNVIRKYDPDLVITHRPTDYHRDHRYTGQLVMDASYMLIVPHYCPKTPIPTLRRIPIICYAFDEFQKPNPFIPNILLDISDVYKQKSEALIYHESQMMDWIPWTLNQENMIPENYNIQNRLEVIGLVITTMFSRLFIDYRKLWKKGYPDKKVIKAEAFEICEYGRKPSVQELKDLFPGAYITSKKDLKELGIIR